MHKFASITEIIIGAADEKRLILSPAKSFLFRLILFFAVFTALLTGSFGMLSIITIPLLLFAFYFTSG